MNGQVTSFQLGNKCTMEIKSIKIDSNPNYID